MEPLGRPRVLHLYKTLAVAQDLKVEDVVSVTLDKTIAVGSGVTASGGASHKDIATGVVVPNLGPEIIDTEVLTVAVNIIWGAGEGAHSPARVSADDVLVVALVFCKGFLKNRDPEGGVGADASEHG